MSRLAAPLTACTAISAVADASRDLKTALLTMRAATTEFVARPSDQHAAGFRRWPGSGDPFARPHRRSARRVASRTLSRRCASPCAISRPASKAWSTSRNRLATTRHDGITAELNAASAAIEKIIHDDLSWVADVDAARLLMSLLTMRRDEIEYRLTRARTAEKHFLDEMKNFNGLFDSVDGAPAMKKKLSDQVQAYSLRLRAMGREHRQYRSRCSSSDRPRYRERVCRKPTRSSPRRATARDEAAKRAGRVAGAYSRLHRLGRFGRRC